VWKLLLIEEIERIAKEQAKQLEDGLVPRPDSRTRTPEDEKKVAEKIHPSNFTAKDLNVLDKIIAMCFERTPVLGDENTHFQVRNLLVSLFVAPPDTKPLALHHADAGQEALHSQETMVRRVWIPPQCVKDERKKEKHGMRT